jgi:hypothetical protein
MASGLRILNSSFLTQADLRHRMQQHLENLELDPGLCCSADLGGQGLHFYLDPDALASHAPGFDTLGLADTLHWSGAISDRDLQREILWTLLASPVVQDFPSYEEFDSASRIRFHLVRAAQRTSMDFKTDEVDRPPEHWQYHPDTGFTLKPGKSLIEALTLATQPVLSGRQYAFSCYRATEYVILLAMAQEAHDHHPDLFNRLQRQWQTRAIMSGPFQETLLREVGSQDQPLPMNWYVPGDRVWFRNPDDASSDVYGFEGSWVIYLGGGLFTNFWQHDQPYDIPSKCLEIYHWRDGVIRDAQGKLSMDETRVKSLVDSTRSCPVKTRQVLERMQRLRDPAGVYAHGGCMDSTREVSRWVRPGTSDIVLPDA